MLLGRNYVNPAIKECHGRCVSVSLRKCRKTAGCSSLVRRCRITWDCDSCLSSRVLLSCALNLLMMVVLGVVGKAWWKEGKWGKADNRVDNVVFISG